MSYTKQNFQPKQPLTAAAMNQIEAGIVANEEAIAAAKNSLLGYETFAGGKGFTITAVADNDDGSTGNYTLSSVTGLEVGMRYSAVLSSANYNAGKITAINANTNIVTVDGYKHIELNSKVDDPENFNVYNCFLIVDRPDLGDKEVGFNAHAEGENTIASNKDAHAEGYKTKAIGKFAHAEGNNTIAGHGAHAEGYRTEAIGESSHAEGNDSRAYGDSAHAEGHSVAHGDYSHAGGLNATTNYTASFAHGSHVSANAEYQAVFGSYNKVNTDAAFMIGNGQSASATSNAFEVNYDGNAYVQQNLFVGGTGTNQSSAKEVATKNDVEAAKTDIKNDLLNGAGTAYDTLKELGDLIDENNDAIAALETVATNKADKSNTVVTGSFSMGRKAGTTVGNNSFAVGTDVTASGTNSSAEGKDTTASGMHSHAEGHISQATGYGAHAENGQTKAIGGYSHAEGYLSEAQGDNSHSEGMKTKAIGNNSHASGQETKAEGANSVAAGHATQAIGNNSFATGAETKASSPDTFTAGLLAKAGGKAFQVSSRIEMPSQDGFAVGGYVVNSMTGLQTAFNEAAAQGQMLYYIAHIEADDYYELGNIIDITRMPNTIIGAGIGLVTPKSDVEKMVIPSVGNYLMIMGCPELGDIEVGLAAFAEGIDTHAQHRGAHVEGISAISAGPGAHAEGILARAVHFGSHAEGFSTIAGGAYSHAGGYASETGADHAFAHGEKVYAYEKNQTVFGQYNQMNPNAAFIVGNGSDDTSRSNAIEILKNGDAIVSKDLYVNGTSKVATTNDLDSLAAELDNIKTKIAAALNKTVEELFG